jgi:hypothetical protein
MMPVRYIDRIHFGKSFSDRRNRRRFINAPDPVHNAVIGRKIIQRRFLHGLLHLCLNVSSSPVSQKYGAGLRIADIHMADSVGFLLRPCILMLFNNLIFVIVHGSTGTDSRLRTPVHNEFINIISRRIFHDKFAPLCHLFQHFPRPFINFRRIHIIVFRELRLRPVDTQKRKRVARGLLPRLFSVVYIIRQCRYLFSQILSWP